MADQLSLDDQRELILNRVAQARVYSKPWHDNIVRWRQLYDLQHYTAKALPGESQFIDPTCTNTVDLAVGIFQTNRMEWKAIGWEPSVHEQEATSDVEKFLAALLDMSSTRNEYDMEYEINLHMVRDGGAVLYTVWDKDLAAQTGTHEEVEGDTVVSRNHYSQIPIHSEVLDPLTIYMLPGGPHRWLCVCRVENMNLYEAETLAGVQSEQGMKLTMTEKLSTDVDLIDYWETSTEMQAKGATKVSINHAILIDTEVVKPLRPAKKYSDLPFDIGMYKPTSRDDSSGWHSILSPLESTVSLFEKSINRRQRQIDVYSSLPLIARTQNGRQIEADQGLGKIVSLSMDESIMLPQWPGNAPDVQKQLDILSARMQQSGFSEIMYGSGSSGESGYQLSQLADQGRIRLQPPMAHLEQLWTRWGRKVLDLMKNFANPERDVLVYGEVKGVPYTSYLHVKDLFGYKVDCTIKAEFPNEKVRNHAMAAQAAGHISEVSLMEKYFDIQQPDDEFQRVLIEQMAKNPVMLQYSVLRELKKRADEGDWAAVQAVGIIEAQLTSSLQGSATQQKTQGAGNSLGTQSTSGAAPAQAVTVGAPGKQEVAAMQQMGTNPGKV